MRRTSLACATPSSWDSRRTIPCPHAVRRESLNGGELRSAGTHGGCRPSGGREGRGGAADGPGWWTEPPGEPGACPWPGPGIQGGGMTLYTHWRRSLAHLRPATIIHSIITVIRRSSIKPFGIYTELRAHLKQGKLPSQSPCAQHGSYSESSQHHLPFEYGRSPSATTHLHRPALRAGYRAARIHALYFSKWHYSDLTPARGLRS